MKTNSQIEDKANEVLAKYVKRGGVYKVFPIIMKEECLKYKEIASQNDAFVGSLTKSTSGKTYVFINANIDNLGRKNFTIAHELGHYFLEHSLLQNEFYCTDGDIIEEMDHRMPIEKEANYFASCLLMPEEKVKNAFLGMLIHSRKTSSNDFLLVRKNMNFGAWCGIRDELTKRYGVSEAALRYRLQKLKVAKFEFEE